MLLYIDDIVYLKNNLKYMNKIKIIVITSLGEKIRINIQISLKYTLFKKIFKNLFSE